MDGGGEFMVYIHFSFTIHKNGKITRTWPTLKSNYTSLSSNNLFLKWIIKKLRNGGLGGPSLFFKGCD